MFECKVSYLVFKNVTGSTMLNARFFSLKSAIPFLKVKKYISIFSYNM